MSRLYHPQWNRTNGDIGGEVFKDWGRELSRFGPDGVLRGIESIRAEGNQYMPNLNKFSSLCRKGADVPAASSTPGEWHTCPYTGRKRRLKDVNAMNPRMDEQGRFLDDPRSDEQIRQDIERMVTANAICALVDGQSVELEQ